MYSSGGIQVLYGRDPGNKWEGSRYYMGGIQVINGRIHHTDNIWEGSR